MNGDHIKSISCVGLAEKYQKVPLNFYHAKRKKNQYHQRFFEKKATPDVLK